MLDHVRAEEVAVAQVVERAVQRQQEDAEAGEEPQGLARVAPRAARPGAGISDGEEPRAEQDVAVELAGRPGEGRGHCDHLPSTRKAPVSVISASTSPVASASGPQKSTASARES